MLAAAMQPWEPRVCDVFRCTRPRRASLPPLHEKRAAPPPVAAEDPLSVVGANCAHLVTFTAKSDTKLVTLVILFASCVNLADLDQFWCSINRHSPFSSVSESG